MRSLYNMHSIDIDQVESKFILFPFYVFEKYLGLGLGYTNTNSVA